MLQSSLYDYTDAYYILVNRTIAVPNTASNDAAAKNTSKKVM